VVSIIAISTFQLLIYKNCQHINVQQSSKLIFSRTSTTPMSFTWAPITKNQGIYNMFLLNKTNNFTKISHSAQINWDHCKHPNTKIPKFAFFKYCKEPQLYNTQKWTTPMATINAQNSDNKTTKSVFQTSIKNEKNNFFAPKLKLYQKKKTTHHHQRR